MSILIVFFYACHEKQINYGKINLKHPTVLDLFVRACVRVCVCVCVHVCACTCHALFFIIFKINCMGLQNSAAISACFTLYMHVPLMSL